MAPLASRQVADTQIFSDSKYFLPRDYVNKFTNDIPLWKAPPVHDPHDEHMGLEESGPELLASGGDPTDGDPSEDVSDCIKN